MDFYQTITTMYKEFMSDNSAAIRAESKDGKMGNAKAVLEDLKRKAVIKMLIEDSVELLKDHAGQKASDFQMDKGDMERAKFRNSIVQSMYVADLTKGLKEEELVSYLNGNTPRPEKMKENLAKIKKDLDASIESFLPEQYKKKEEPKNEKKVTVMNYNKLESQIKGKVKNAKDKIKSHDMIDFERGKHKDASVKNGHKNKHV